MRGARLLLIAVVGCGAPKSPPPAPTVPTVQVATTSQHVIGTELVANVSVEGCDSVKTLVLSDHQHALSTVTNAQPSTQFTLHETDLQPLYATDGIAAGLDLVATVTCADGQTASSDGAGVTFMPADEVFPGVFPGTNLSIEPDGSGLVLCLSGEVARVDTQGNVLASTGTQLPYMCTDQGFLVRGGTDELYWVEPTSAFSRLNQSLNVLNTFSFAAAQIYLPPNGSGFAVAEGPVGTGAVMYWVDRASGATSNSFTLSASVDGTPALGQEGLVVPVDSIDPSTNIISLGIEVWNLSTGLPTTDTGPVVLATLPGTMYGTTPIPLISLSADGARAYFVGGAAQNQVYGCAIDLPCTDSSQGGGQLFLEQLSVGAYTAVIPSGTSLIAIGPKNAQFLDGTKGTLVGSPITPSGGLVLLSVVQGPGASTYLLSGDHSGNMLELIILDSPAHEAARYTIDTGGFGFDVDAALRAYLLEGSLESLLLPSDYALARQ